MVDRQLVVVVDLQAVEEDVETCNQVAVVAAAVAGVHCAPASCKP